MEGENPGVEGGSGGSKCWAEQVPHTFKNGMHTWPRRSGDGGEIVHVAPACASFVPASPSEHCLLAEWMRT